MNRRKFLGSSLSAGAAIAAAPRIAGAWQTREAQSETSPRPVIKKLPIGVFNPPFRSLSLDAMLDKYVSLGAEAAEIGAGGYTGTPQCPVPELLADPAKARAWKKKFDDRGIPIMTISCHANALHPDPVKGAAFALQFRQAIQLAGMLEIPTVVGFSGCPGGSPTDITPTWVVYGWPPDHSQALAWQWKERVIPYWQETVKFARDHGVRRIALEMHPNFVVYNPRTLLRLREAVGEEIGANCDLSHLFWQQCNPVEVIRFLGKQGAIYHAHMKDTAFFQENVDRFGVLNFASSAHDQQGSEFFRAVGYGHGASLWKDVIAAYMEVGYDGMLSIENEDHLLSGEVGVTRSLAVLKNVREELLAGQFNPGEHV
ncbi:sugar phosphate isomerase/epimerase family protein [Paracidobacterium acidisoli]|uniref:sugar phosphate isomerase/epimerase family protein n=1 Tax=Paracidobacterium acidisoli TaxID=2303751 RepID=UPI0018F119D5|nr:sugar phosphate isomerase/epimerase [Paracidobacterium acidisoli]MBT9330100.1 sugar phosphate isomerase/epimerase [Paracidobacterium acidisoli]